MGVIPQGRKRGGGGGRSPGQQGQCAASFGDFFFSPQKRRFVLEKGFKTPYRCHLPWVAVWHVEDKAAWGLGRVGGTGAMSGRGHGWWGPAATCPQLLPGDPVPGRAVGLRWRRRPWESRLLGGGPGGASTTPPPRGPLGMPGPAQPAGGPRSCPAPGLRRAGVRWLSARG